MNTEVTKMIEKKVEEEYEVRVFVPGILGPEPGKIYPEEMRKPMYYIVKKEPQKGYPEKKSQKEYVGQKEPVEEKEKIYKQ